MNVARRYTWADVERLPHVEGTRYEIIDGELLVSTQPRWEHQYACTEVIVVLQSWNHRSRLGIAVGAPGVIFPDGDGVAPDVVWISHARLAAVKDAAGHLLGAPELVVEVLSPGASNVRRDREAKLRLYSRWGVDEYWIVDWRAQRVDVFRREADALRRVATLGSADTLMSPLLPGFTCSVSTLWLPAVT